MCIERDAGVIPPVEEFPEIQSRGFGIVLGTYEAEFLSGRGDNYPLNQKLHENLQSGLSIGYGDVDIATLGLLVHEEGGSNVIGLTAGHLIEEDSMDIMQPGLLEFRRRVACLEDLATRVQNEIRKTNEPSQQQAYHLQLASIDSELKLLRQFNRPKGDDVARSIRAGTVRKYEFRPYHYESRTCILDYCLFDVDDARKPQPPPIWLGNPPQEGDLGSVKWSPVKCWGRLTYDQPVRKEGRTTGETYGFVAGVHSSWKRKEFKITCSEYFVLEEGNLEDRNTAFARKGDSGAMVIDNDGKIVGMIMALVKIRDIQVILHPITKAPDILEIVKQQHSNGSLDTNRAWFESFYNCSLVLVEDARMIVERANLGKDPSHIIKDC